VDRRERQTDREGARLERSTLATPTSTLRCKVKLTYIAEAEQSGEQVRYAMTSRRLLYRLVLFLLGRQAACSVLPPRLQSVHMTTNCFQATNREVAAPIRILETIIKHYVSRRIAVCNRRSG